MVQNGVLPKLVPYRFSSAAGIELKMDLGSRKKC